LVDPNRPKKIDAAVLTEAVGKGFAQVQGHHAIAVSFCLAFIGLKHNCCRKKPLMHVEAYTC